VITAIKELKGNYGPVVSHGIEICEWL